MDDAEIKALKRRLENAERFIAEIVEEGQDSLVVSGYRFPTWVYQRALAYCERYGIEGIKKGE